MNLIRVGKVKEVYEVDNQTLEFVFTDNISVFDKIIPSHIPFKGETLCRTAVFWFQLLKSKGVRTHFKEYIPPNRMRVKRFEVIKDYDAIGQDTRGYLIPLEIITRHYVAGSLMDRLKSGDLSPENLGFPAEHEIKYGEKLPKPFVEVTTKLEQYDRHVDLDEALKMSGLSEAEYEEMIKIALYIDSIIDEEAAERLLIHVDGKKEFGLNENREFVVIDTFGTMDEDRWWDIDSYSAGKPEELSKEFVRRYYRDIGYFDELMKARQTGEPEPDIPPLPEDLVKRVSNLYVDMFERITGESFR
ncbi:MAG: phosphoribosylaminoimidazole-succinocarboxamide synthase [Candidatus Methanomethylophilaceae archaeon]|nr:phosphoribosylaminoimidazole-succinocarboxamide synthase [Candidatus Methanomethylophilaceae archaeon]MDI3541783.1 phosphoribosylaminoimidazole-succinocarboxamide synthase [Candidatus Methanomethylophilaceae archaeon]